MIKYEVRSWKYEVVNKKAGDYLRNNLLQEFLLRT